MKLKKFNKVDKVKVEKNQIQKFSKIPNDTETVSQTYISHLFHHGSQRLLLTHRHQSNDTTSISQSTWVSIQGEKVSVWCPTTTHGVLKWVHRTISSNAHIERVFLWNWRISTRLVEVLWSSTLDALERQMFAGKLRTHHQNGTEVCARRMLAVTNDETSFQVLVLLCWYPKMTHRAFAFVSTFGVLPRKNPPHAQQSIRFEIQFLFLREATDCISSQNLWQLHCHCFIEL